MPELQDRQSFDPFSGMGGEDVRSMLDDALHPKASSVVEGARAGVVTISEADDLTAAKALEAIGVLERTAPEVNSFRLGQGANYALSIWVYNTMGPVT